MDQGSQIFDHSCPSAACTEGERTTNRCRPPPYERATPWLPTRTAIVTSVAARCRSSSTGSTSTAAASTSSTTTSSPARAASALPGSAPRRTVPGRAGRVCVPDRHHPQAPHRRGLPALRRAALPPPVRPRRSRSRRAGWVQRCRCAPPTALGRRPEHRRGGRRLLSLLRAGVATREQYRAAEDQWGTTWTDLATFHAHATADA